jgi:hypothetical protein
MSVTVLGLEIENPTAVWMQLTNTRRQVLHDRKFWNSGGWYGVGTGGKVSQVPTMCLANALRHVAFGRKGVGASHSDREIDTAEQLVIGVINAHFAHLQGTVAEIPSFNDHPGRRHEQITKVLDKAIELIEPHARTWALAIADDVMTDEERQEIAVLTRRAEDDLWAEWYRDRPHRDKKGRWRLKGKFAKAPAWKTKAKPKTTQADVKRFERDLKDLDKRGWDTFWQELTACPDDDKECQERAKQFA